MESVECRCGHLTFLRQAPGGSCEAPVKLLNQRRMGDRSGRPTTTIWTTNLYAQIQGHQLPNSTRLSSMY